MADAGWGNPYSHCIDRTTRGCSGGTPATGTKNPRLAALDLTPDEKADLVSFLEVLCGERVPRKLLRASP